MRRKEKILKTRAGWKKADQVRKIKIMMTFISVALCVSVAAGAGLAWLELTRPFDSLSSQSQPPEEEPPLQEELPVYGNELNLLVVNRSTELPKEYMPQLESFDDIIFDRRILPALREMLADAAAAGCPLSMAGGYVSREDQDAMYRETVQSLIAQGYTQVRAEGVAQESIGRGGFNENQTGLAVTFTTGDSAQPDFSQTDAYKWLVKNSVKYGFVLRYPMGKSSLTGVEFNPAQFRYVGSENAVKMREYSMCLEEYAQYIARQSR